MFCGDRAMPGRYTGRGSKVIRKSEWGAQAEIGHSGRPGPEKTVGATHWIGSETGWPKASRRLGRSSSRSSNSQCAQRHILTRCLAREYQRLSKAANFSAAHKE